MFIITIINTNAQGATKKLFPTPHLVAFGCRRTVDQRAADGEQARSRGRHVADERQHLRVGSRALALLRAEPLGRTSARRRLPRSADLGGGEGGLRAGRNHVAFLLDYSGVQVQHEGVGVSAEFSDDERDALSYKSNHEREAKAALSGV